MWLVSFTGNFVVDGQHFELDRIFHNKKTVCEKRNL